MVLVSVFFFNDTATTEIYTYLHTLSLHDALPIFLRGSSDPHIRLAEMDQKGIDILVVSNNAQMYFYNIDAGLAIDFHQTANDALAEYCEAEPDRLFFMAMLPLQDLEASARELDRAIELGARAVTVGAHSIAGRELYRSEEH